MTPKFIAIATVIAAAVTFSATAADAGSGVRLNFGLPLGNFTATPSRGGGADYGDVYARKAAGRQAAAAKKAARVAKAEEAAPSKTSSSSKKSQEAASTTTSTSTSTTSSSGSTALIDTANQATAASQTTQTAAIEPTKTDEPAKVTETSTSADTAPVEAQKDNTKDEPKKDEVKTASSGKKLNCKKFIPAIGITVSVSCGD